MIFRVIPIRVWTVLAVMITGMNSVWSNTDDWGGRDAVRAVVNDVCESTGPETISLSGTWEFMTRGVDFASGSCMEPDSVWEDSREIEVPGSWESQGVGSGPELSTVWDYYRSRLVPPQEVLLAHVYNGNAWYRKWVDVPAEWNGGRVWLAVGGVRSVGWFYLNGQRVALVDNFCGTYKYDVTDLIKPGERNLIAVRVRNDLPSRKGMMSWLHSWGGLYRAVELQWTPKQHLEDVWVRGDFDKMSVEVQTTVVGNSSPESMAKSDANTRRLDVRITDSKGTVAGQASCPIESGDTREVQLSVPIADMVPWSPANPFLYNATIRLYEGDNLIQERKTRFGVRKLEVRGQQIYLNNQPFFLRMFGDDWIYFNTLTSPASREAHLKNLQMAKDAGFNAIRLHTHCELPEYFEAADELGFLIQPELPYYSEYPADGFDFDPMRDLKELVEHYRQHVSLGIFSMGNEGWLGHPVDEKLYQYVKKHDPGCLVLHQDGGTQNIPGKNSDFISGPINTWTNPLWGSDYSVPFVCHEYLNISIKHDPRWESMFSGVTLPLRTIAAYEEELRNVGLTRAWGDACLDSAQTLQKHYQKRGLEAARRSPYCDGYSFWTLADTAAPDDGVYTSQGLFSPFWTVKNCGNTPESFRVFNQDTVLLTGETDWQNIYVSGDQVTVPFLISHYGTQDIPAGEYKVTIIKKDGTTCAEGTLTSDVVPVGRVQELGSFTFEVPSLEHPERTEIRITTPDGTIANSWEMWFFPKRPEISGAGIAVPEKWYEILSKRYPGVVPLSSPDATNAELVIGDEAEVQAALIQGKKALLLRDPGGDPNITLGWWWLGNQVGTAFARHDAFGDFPHSGNLDSLWFRILRTGTPLNANNRFIDAEFLAVGEGKSQYFLYAAQANVESGKLLLVPGIDLLTETPEGTWLLDNLIHYMRTDAFLPQKTCKKYW